MKLNSDQSDVLAEVVNIGVGRAAASLSELIGMRIEIVVPTVKVLNPRQAAEMLGEGDSTSISQEFSGIVSGRAALVFPQGSGIALAKLLTDRTEAVAEFDIELSGVLTEVGNIVLNCIMGTLANMLDTRLDYTVPQFSTVSIIREFLLKSDTASGEATGDVLIADAQFQVSQRDISGSLITVFELGSIEHMLEILLREEAPQLNH